MKVNQIVGHCRCHVQTRECRTFLSPHTERATHDAGRGPFQVGAGSHDARVLATHFGDTRFRIPAFGQATHDLHAHVV